jgi:hypothetical protein
MYVTIPMVDYIPLGYNRKSPNSKNGYVFHNYEKSKARKQKNRHSYDDKKYIKVAIPMLIQKYRFETMSSQKINFEQKKRTCFLKRQKRGYISYR